MHKRNYLKHHSRYEHVMVVLYSRWKPSPARRAELNMVLYPIYCSERYWESHQMMTVNHLGLVISPGWGSVSIFIFSIFVASVIIKVTTQFNRLASTIESYVENNSVISFVVRRRIILSSKPNDEITSCWLRRNKENAIIISNFMDTSKTVHMFDGLVMSLQSPYRQSARRTSDIASWVAEYYLFSITKIKGLTLLDCDVPILSVRYLSINAYYRNMKVWYRTKDGAMVNLFIFRRHFFINIDCRMRRRLISASSPTFHDHG